jgi:hypothetical protein
MPSGVTRRHLLKGLVAGGLFGVPPLASPAAPASAPAPAQPPRCNCPRTLSYCAYVGDAPTIPTTLTYQCPRCGRQVVEHGFRMAGACYAITSGGRATHS